MQITLTPFRGGGRGYALIITMIFLTVCLVIFASMMMWTSTNAKINQRNNQYTMSQMAAEAATEKALATMMRDFLSQTLATNANTYATNIAVLTNFDGSAWPVRYTFSDASGTTGRITVVHGDVQPTLIPLGTQYANLQGFPWLWTNIATATPIGQPYTVPATITQVINFTSIPIFQYAIFYNLDLEMDAGQPMVVNGAVWSNRGFWGGTANLTFNSTVTSVNLADLSTIDPFVSGGSKTDGSAPPNFSLPNQPSQKNTPLIMPIAGATNSDPTNVESILNIPPAAYAMGSSAAYTTNGLNYLANAADLVISNSINGTNWQSLIPYGTNLTIYYQDPLNASPLTKLKPDFYFITNGNSHTVFYTNYVSPTLLGPKTNIYFASWSFVTNADFYDYRESATVQSVQIDVGLFNNWLTNTAATNNGILYNSQCIGDKGHPIDSIWVYNSVPLTTTTLPAVRVKNGIQLPSPYGFSVVTPMPIYVYGNYNTQTNATHTATGTNTFFTYPAALMGDAITILSGAWSDSYTSATSVGSRNASDTTVNAACLEGIVQSTASSYSGGVENFLRYLETWDGNNSVYNGSIVVMFPSIIATNTWSYGSYYTAPNRQWGFDYNFLQQAKLPPLTPQLKKSIRVSWNAQ